MQTRHTHMTDQPDAGVCVSGAGTRLYSDWCHTSDAGLQLLGRSDGICHHFLPQQPRMVLEGQLPPRPSGLEEQTWVLQQATANPRLQRTLLPLTMLQSEMLHRTEPPCISLRWLLVLPASKGLLGPASVRDSRRRWEPASKRRAAPPGKLTSPLQGPTAAAGRQGSSERLLKSVWTRLCLGSSGRAALGVC